MIKRIILKMNSLLVLPALLISCSLLGQKNEPTHGLPVEDISSESWEKAKVNATGGNHVSGVDVFFRVDNCNSKQHIILKFVNNNTEDVTIEWADGVYTHDKHWLHNERNDKSRAIELKGLDTIQGSCKSGAEGQLRFDAAQYLGDSKKKFSYAPSYIEVSK